MNPALKETKKPLVRLGTDSKSVMPRDERGSGLQLIRKTRFDFLFRTEEKSKPLSQQYGRRVY